MASNSKQYGLILPQKANQGLVRDRPSVFKDSSDSEEEGGGATDWVRKALKRESERTFVKKQHQLDMQKALAEDPTVYQYDEVYDKIEEKKAELSNAKKQLDKKPRYIQSLLQQAEKRKRENERRNERIIQKEREAEGDQFKDKESFVTSAYRQKLEEFKKLEEEEKYQDAIEALTDVSKQKDLSGFYRHLYRQTVTGEHPDKTIKTEKDEVVENSAENNVPRSEDVVKEEPEEMSIESKNTSGNAGPSSADNSDTKNTSRHYRKRKNSSASSNSENENTSKSKSNENIDADSDFSVDSDSSESGSEGSDKEKVKEKNKKKDSEKSASTISVKNTTTNSGESNEVPSSTSGKRSGEGDANEGTGKKRKETKADKNEDVAQDTKAVDKEKKEITPKVNIWIKRTVGEVFENALQRYYQRKAEKIASKG